MAVIADLIIKPSQRTLGYAERLLADIPAAEASRLPVGPGERVPTNHPAFIFGHLALYPARICEFVEHDPQPVAVAAGWDDLFKPGVECQDDPDRSIYPALNELTEAFFSSYKHVYGLLPAIDEAVFAQPVPIEGYRDAFGTNGNAINFMLNNHIMNHLGQLSAWRRMMGLGAA